MSVEKHYSAKDIQELFGVGQTKAYMILAKCNCFKDGMTVRVSESELERHINRNTRDGLNFEVLSNTL